MYIRSDAITAMAAVTSLRMGAEVLAVSLRCFASASRQPALIMAWGRGNKVR